MSDKSLSQEKINNLILLYKKGLIKEALAEAKQLIESYPNSFFLHNIHGLINKIEFILSQYFLVFYFRYIFYTFPNKLVQYDL